MKGVLSPRPAALLAEMLFLLFKGAINLAVWVVAFSDRYLAKQSSDHTDLGLEPRYVSKLLRLILPNDKGDAILGDSVQHYRTICKHLGKREGDQWLFEETVESLLRLILRRAFVSQICTSIRSFFRSLSLQERIATIKSRANGLLVLSHGVWCHPGSQLASLALVALALASTMLLYRAPLQQVDNFEVPSDQPISSKAVAVNNQNPQLFPITPVEISTPTSNAALGNRRQVSKARSNTRPPVPSENITLDMFEADRESKESKSLSEVPNKLISFSLPLPPGSKSGLYQVTLQDSGGNNLANLTASSLDGKSLHARFDMRRFIADEYRILISQKKEEVATSDYRFRINKR